MKGRKEKKERKKKKKEEKKHSLHRSKAACIFEEERWGGSGLRLDANYVQLKRPQRRWWRRL
jgi:hypothetical protein